MKNALVVCGGTGAHVALAMVRLHTLGYALGFFRRPDGKPLDFPTLYLVDQDSGDGTQKATAWQNVRRLVDNHPGRHDWRAAIGRPDSPKLRIVTPLPVGNDRTWFDPPFDTLGRRCTDSPYLSLLTSLDQRDIRFSHGMMGSPAVGALLFRLKQYDTKPGGANHDDAYHELLSERGRVAVAGSAVGGTGAAVGPTLARQLADTGANVMAVMVLNWFRFQCRRARRRDGGQGAAPRPLHDRERELRVRILRTDPGPLRGDGSRGHAGHGDLLQTLHLGHAAARARVIHPRRRSPVLPASLSRRGSL